MNRTKVMLAVIFGAALAFNAVGCDDDNTTNPPKEQTFSSTPVTLGNGTARSWVKLDASGNPSAVGLTLTEAALTGLPTDSTMPAGYEIDLPSQASATAYNHIGLDWNVIGHPPAPIYSHPHFDIHFYHITKAERDAIMPHDTVKGHKMPEADYVPAGYVAPMMEIVPRMGVHFIDPNSHEFHGTMFDKTMIYGFWNGNMIFTEPMITTAYLQTKPNFTEDLKLPAKYPKAGVYYATKYSIRYDSTAKEYIIALEGLTKR